MQVKLNSFKAYCVCFYDIALWVEKLSLVCHLQTFVCICKMFILNIVVQLPWLCSLVYIALILLCITLK